MLRKPAQPLSVKVKDGTTVVFSNIPKGCHLPDKGDAGRRLSLTEIQWYRVAGGKSGTITDTAAGAGTVGMTQSVEIENKRETTIDTGIFLSDLPYVFVLAGIAAAALLFFAGKKRRDREK